MYREENRTFSANAHADTVADAMFNIGCDTLPVDHAYALSQAIQRALPWFADEANAGLYLAHVAGSGNGWMRPGNPRALLYLSRRTKLALRLPKQRIADAAVLLGQTLDVDGHLLRIDTVAVRPLARITTLFSRYVALPAGDDEAAFVTSAARELGGLGIQPRKMLCGLATAIATPAHTVQTRSLMLAELTLEESVLLQEQGLGLARSLGCG